MYKGNIASFFPRAKKNVTLMFHQGASIDDPSGLLEGDGETSRVARFLDEAGFEAKKPALEAVIRHWIRDHSWVPRRRLTDRLPMEGSRACFNQGT